jgi:hypothetical protein
MPGVLTAEDARDYHDLIEWAARQPWASGLDVLGRDADRYPVLVTTARRTAAGIRFTPAADSIRICSPRS